jgi:hypothetical protein
MVVTEVAAYRWKESTGRKTLEEGPLRELAKDSCGRAVLYGESQLFPWSPPEHHGLRRVNFEGSKRRQNA